MNEAYFFFYCKITLVVQNQEKNDFQMFVIHLNGATLKTLLLQTLIILLYTCGRNMSLYGQILLPKQLF